MTQHNTDGGAGAGRGSFGRMPLYTNPDISVLIDRAIQEDLGLGDATTDALVPSDLPGEAGHLRQVSGGVVRRGGVPGGVSPHRPSHGH